MIYDGLKADSAVYTKQSEMYELFSQAEDSLGKIVEFLRPKIAGKTVLDFGCGTGKFIRELSPVVERYLASDISEAQLGIARKKTSDLTNVEIFKTERNKIPFEDGSIDNIFSTFVIGGIHDLELRARVSEELKRVLRVGGKIYLIENDVGGEYKEITGGAKANERTIAKLKWLKNHGYNETEKIKIQFEFKSIEEAKDVFEAVWNMEAAEKVKGNIIKVNLVVCECGK